MPDHPMDPDLDAHYEQLCELVESEPPVSVPKTEVQNGPKVTLAFACTGCAHLSSSSWSRADGACGGNYYCQASSSRPIYSSATTPEWCPLRSQAEEEFRKTVR